MNLVKGSEFEHLNRKVCAKNNARYGQIVPFTAASSPKSKVLPFLKSLKASKLEDVPLFSTSPLLSTNGLSTTTSEPQKLVMVDVPLDSEMGMDYTTLRDVLKAGDFRKADDETRALLIKLAGNNAVKRGWVYFSEVKDIAAKDLQTIDNLWKAASNGKFGYSVQRELWLQNSKRWQKFFKKIDWTAGPNSVYRKWPMEFTYSLDAVKGHLPLTNALRGTQLFQAILEHPAFEKAQAKSIDQSVADASKSTLKWPSF